MCIGVSGGKDSLLLMEALKLYQRFSRTKFEVCAVSLDLGIVEQDWSAVIAFAERIGMDYSLIKTDIGDVVFNIRQEKSPCALCAKLRRGALNNAARDRGCNKVALGHNREDVIETFFMSLLYEGRVNTFAPVTYLSRSDVTVIRPLVFLPEKHALSVARNSGDMPLPSSLMVMRSVSSVSASRISMRDASAEMEFCTISRMFSDSSFMISSPAWQRKLLERPLPPPPGLRPDARRSCRR